MCHNIMKCVYHYKCEPVFLSVEKPRLSLSRTVSSATQEDPMFLDSTNTGPIEISLDSNNLSNYIIELI